MLCSRACGRALLIQTHEESQLAAKRNVHGRVHFNDQVVRFQYLSKK